MDIQDLKERVTCMIQFIIDYVIFEGYNKITKIQYRKLECILN